MNPGAPMFDPMSRAEIVRVLEQPMETYPGPQYLRITRLDGSDVVGVRDSPAYGIASQYIDGEQVESYEVAADVECVSLDNAGFRPGCRALIPLAQVAAIYYFGIELEGGPAPPIRAIQSAATRAADAVLSALGLNLITSQAVNGGSRMGKPVFVSSRDFDVYRDLEFFGAHDKGLTYLGIDVIAGGLSLGWQTSLAAAAHDRIQHEPNPYVGVCQDAEVVLKGFVFFFLDDTGRPPTMKIGNRDYIQGIVQETPASDDRRGSWVPVYFAEDLIVNYPLELFLQIDRPLHVYGETVGVKYVTTGAGTASCYIIAHLAAYLSPAVKRPGRLKRLLLRIIH